MMLDEHDKRERCVIARSSNHNEHIERLWRDVHRSVVVFLGNLFQTLETEGHFDDSNKVDIYCLHYVFVPRYIIFVTGLLSHSCTSNSDCDSDLEGAEHFDMQSSDAVSVPHCSFNPCEQLLKELASLVNPLSQCCSYGRSIYLAAIRVCGNHLTHDCDDCMHTG